MDVVFVPEVDAIYPPELDISVPPLPLVATKPQLEDACRPGHFAGVCQVVARLFDLVKPSVAVFGEKDYQQLLVIRRLTRDLDIPVAIEAVPTVRDDDGLALASRNAYLTKEEREIAPALFGTLSQVAENVGRGVDTKEQAAWGLDQLERAGFGKIDYFTVRDAETLEPAAGASRPARVLAAAWLGKARLIDNVAV